MVPQAFGGLGVWAMPGPCGGFCVEGEEIIERKNVASLVDDEHC